MERNIAFDSAAVPHVPIPQKLSTAARAVKLASKGRSVLHGPFYKVNDNKEGLDNTAEGVDTPVKAISEKLWASRAICDLFGVSDSLQVQV